MTDQVLAFRTWTNRMLRFCPLTTSSRKSLANFLLYFSMIATNFSCTSCPPSRMKRHLLPPWKPLMKKRQTLPSGKPLNSIIPPSSIELSQVFINFCYEVQCVGMVKTIVTCGKCHKQSITYNPFMTLSLAFESSLDKCLTNYLREDVLSSQNKYKCEKCQHSSKAKIKTELCKLPTILVFHLKRFSFPSMQKIKGKVKYSSYLDMDK